MLIGHIFSNNPKILPYIVGVPKFGVWMFFALSSFLLTNYFLSRPERVYQPIEWLNYIFRRFVRIYPIYAVVLFLYYLYHHEINSLVVIKQSLLLQTGIMQFWTIPVEFKFYLIFPFVILGIVTVGRMNVKRTLGLAVLFISIHQMISPYTHALPSSIYLVQYLPVFIIGCIGSLIHQKLSKISFTHNQRFALDIFATVIIAGLILITPYPMKHLLGHMPPDQYLVNKFIFIGFACVLLILSIVHGKLLKHFFATRVMRFFGKISYSGYLIHWLFIQIFIGQYFKSLTFVSGFVVFFLTVLSAVIIHYVIERPCTKLNLLKSRKERATTAAAQ